MRKRFSVLLILMVISNHFVFGKHGTKTKPSKLINKNNNNLKNKTSNARTKRSVSDGIGKLFLPAKEKFYENDLEDSGEYFNPDLIDNSAPFWATRGRRESGSEENVIDVQLPAYNFKKLLGKERNVYKEIQNANLMQRREEVEAPFWGNRGRRDSDESDDNTTYDDLFWATRGRRQDDDPFWGTRGKKQEESPFWGNRGRRESLLSKYDLPFWSSRGRRDDEEPFWGNRGRREETEPFWGNRGRREKFEPFWGSRGKKKLKSNKKIEESEPFWGNRGRRKLKDSIIEAIYDAQNNIDSLVRYRRNEVNSPYWSNRGRESKIRYLFNNSLRSRFHNMPHNLNLDAKLNTKSFEQNTVHDNRMFAEEPHYILVERSSRSSGEDDPFFISRGKKFGEFELAKVARGRRGALEEIVKSVRNDPYYIARGKKDNNYLKMRNITINRDNLIKTKELICATTDFLMSKKGENKVKRDVYDNNDRDRRTILKKLALQLQMDPYFVSRGKKNYDMDNNINVLEEFINKIIVLCN